jgi:soluble lytic murein transglycosylase-like protein
LPASPRLLAPALFGLGLLCGCSQTAGTRQAALAPGASAIDVAAEPSVVLPETVAYAPSASPRGASLAAQALMAEATPATNDVFDTADAQAVAAAPAEEGPVAATLAVAGTAVSAAATAVEGALAPVTTPARGQLDGLISKYAQLYDVPVELVHKVAKRESNYNPNAQSKGNWGLMQIRHATAKGMGYRGTARGLLDAETNLKYAVKYLRGAWLVAEGDAKRADWLYRTGYYYDAKRKGLLEETGLGRDRVRRRMDI